MTVVITEKPSVANDIAKFLQADRKCDGYFEGNGYRVTWAFGHLVALKEPQDYTPSWKRWSLETLPMLPSEFQLKLIEAGRNKKQLKIIQGLIKNSGRLICATDAGREGELIFRNILRFLSFEDKPFERLWLSSLTPEAIGEAFKTIKPGTNYNNLYQAARCRSEADWIVGINGTRNLTVRFGQKILWSMGRVQTPVLAMLADRDDEISTFKSEPFWELYTKYRDVPFKHSEKFGDKAKAEELLKKVEPENFTIEKVGKKREKAHPPLLFDLTELQREMNRRFGLSANDTLNAAQSLYEAKYITYPRTDSQYLSTDMKEKIPGILKNLEKRWSKEASPLTEKPLPFSSRMINDKKVSDHHAIIPTGRLPFQLPQDQERIFEAVALRLIAGFYPSCEKDVTTVEGTSSKVKFSAKGVIIVNPGWTALYPKEKEEKGGDEEILPNFEKGESGPHSPYLKEGKTTPPKHYNENSLLGAMATAGKQVDDEELREALKERGLGTPATRASIIETLISRKYVERSKKTLTITPLGRYLVALIQDPQLKSAEMTGNWEQKLKQIEKGELAPEIFMKAIEDFTRSFLSGSDVSRIDRTQIGPCPLCQSQIIQGSRGYGCSDWKSGCPFVIWKDYKGKVISLEEVQRLVQRKILFPPFINAEGKRTILALTSKGKVIEIDLPQQKSLEKP